MSVQFITFWAESKIIIWTEIRNNYFKDHNCIYFTSQKKKKFYRPSVAGAVPHHLCFNITEKGQIIVPE